MQSRPEKRPFWPEHLPRLQLKCCGTPISCNRGQKNAPFRPNACRVCSWNAAERRFYAIAAGRMPLSVGMFAAACGVLCAPVRLLAALCAPYRTPRSSPYALPRLLALSALLCLPRLQLECLRRPIPCNRGREKCPFWPECLAAFATGTLQNADFVQSRPGECPFPQECLSRLHLECRRTQISCNRGRRNAPFGPNACRVCFWSVAERRFRAIAAGRTPFPARMLAAFATGMPQNADFVQSRPEKRLFPPECPAANIPFRPNACRVCSWSAVEGRFHAIAAGRNAPFRRNACRVCSWSAAERRFHAIAARKTPPAAGMLAAFASGMPQNADFMQSRPENRPFWPEHLPRL